MKITFENYLARVKSKLTCNINTLYEGAHYAYTENDIDENIEYFQMCFEIKRSTTDALILFHSYLNEPEI